MQMRYQLRHSPRCRPRVSPRTTRGILANRRGRTAKSGPAGGRGCTAVQPPAAAAGGASARAPPSRSCPCRAACGACSRRPAEQRSQRRPGGRRRARRRCRSRPGDGGRAARSARRHPVARPAAVLLGAGHGVVSWRGRTRRTRAGCRRPRTRRGSAPRASPTSYSRSRASYVGVEAGRRGDVRRGLAGAGRGREDHSRDGRQRGEAPARRPRPGRGRGRRAATSACPWTRPRGVPGGLAVPQQDEPAGHRLVAR